MTNCPTLLGHVGGVTGASVSVIQSPTIGSGVAIIGGNTYRVGQVGSFVRIPQGYNDLYGIVTEVGAAAVPPTQKDLPGNLNRWMTIQLLGEIIGASFERGISQYPTVNDEVHLVTEKDLAVIYGSRSEGQVVIGRLSNAEGIPVRLDLDKLVTRHCAVLGSTGSGKSTTVASILRSIVCGGREEDDHPYPSARVLVLDIHGEYGKALSSVAKVFRVGAGQGEEELFVPYWALDSYFLLDLLMGKLDDKQTASILDKIYAAKESRLKNSAVLGMELNSLTSESPIPFSLKQLWLDLYDPEVKTWADMGRTNPALAPDSAADAETLTPPKYLPASAGNAAPFLNQKGILGIRRGLDHMRSRLLDRQFNFLLHPGGWEPDLQGVTAKDLPELLQAWVGHDKPITILDLSGIPSAVLDPLIGAILRIIYEGLFWGREKTEGGISRPLLVVMDEAHRYLSKEREGPGITTVQRIMREGRKFGIGAMIISQRPSEVNETVLSQCGTFIALRLNNSADRSRVQSTLPDSLAGLTESLPILRIGEAVITGEAARLPIRCRISLPAEEYRPSSEDPLVSASWLKDRISGGYDRVVASWRSQNPRWTPARPKRVALQESEEDMDRMAVESSTAVSVGYDSQNQTLEVEFRSGGVYQYYNVPEMIHEQMMNSESVGKFIHTYIKPAYPCSRV